MTTKIGKKFLDDLVYFFYKKNMEENKEKILKFEIVEDEPLPFAHFLNSLLYVANFTRIGDCDYPLHLAIHELSILNKRGNNLLVLSI